MIGGGLTYCRVLPRMIEWWLGLVKWQSNFMKSSDLVSLFTIWVVVKVGFDSLYLRHTLQHQTQQRWIIFHCCQRNHPYEYSLTSRLLGGNRCGLAAIQVQHPHYVSKWRLCKAEIHVHVGEFPRCLTLSARTFIFDFRCTISSSYRDWEQCKQ